MVPLVSNIKRTAHTTAPHNITPRETMVSNDFYNTLRTWFSLVASFNDNIFIWRYTWFYCFFMLFTRNRLHFIWCKMNLTHCRRLISSLLRFFFFWSLMLVSSDCKLDSSKKKTQTNLAFKWQIMKISLLWQKKKNFSWKINLLESVNHHKKHFAIG